MAKFRKKPVEIEARQVTDDNAHALANWIKSNGAVAFASRGAGDDLAVYIDTLEGRMQASIGDWIIRGVKGEFYPCKPDIFDATYDAVDSDALNDST